MAGFEGVATQPVPRWLTTAVRGAFFYVIDMAFVVGIIFVYFLLRGLPKDRIALSTENAFRIVDVERSLGIFREPAWQSAMLDNERLVRLANFTYMDLHLPFLATFGLAFFLADGRKHRIIRNTILLSAFLAVPIYFLFPVTPPRLMSSAGYPLGIWDTIPVDQRDKPGSLANWYAAMPSYHFGWIALAMAGGWWCWKAWIIRAAALAFAGLMWWAIVVTGNHYFLDMVAGVCMVSIAFYLVLQFARWAERNPEKVSRITVRCGPLRLPF
jgi:membrane-associated phospholipid phosphatase